MCILKNLTPRYVSSSRNAIVTHALCDWCLGVIINYETWKFDWVLIFADFRFILDPLKKVLRKIMSCKNKTPEKLLPLSHKNLCILVKLHSVFDFHSKSSSTNHLLCTSLPFSLIFWAWKEKLKKTFRQKFHSFRISMILLLWPKLPLDFRTTK